MNIRSSRLFAAFALLPLAAGMCAAQQGGGQPGGAARGPQGPPFQMTLDGFADGATVPIKYSCLGSGNTQAEMHGTNPAMSWKNAPMGTQSFVVLVHDIEPHPMKGARDNPHWSMWNLPASATGIPEGVPAGALLPDGSHQASSHNVVQYYGPCAPPGIDHHYVYEVWALDNKLDIPTDAVQKDVINAADGHVLGAAVWTAKYHRPANP